MADGRILRTGNKCIKDVTGYDLVHLLVGRLHFLHRHKGWLSFSGGAAAAYVFVYILPKLGYQQLILAGAWLLSWPLGQWPEQLPHPLQTASLTTLMPLRGLNSMAE